MGALRDSAGKVIGAIDGPGQGCSLFVCPKSTSHRVGLGCQSRTSASAMDDAVRRGESWRFACPREKHDRVELDCETTKGSNEMRKYTPTKLTPRDQYEVRAALRRAGLATDAERDDQPPPLGEGPGEREGALVRDSDDAQLPQRIIDAIFGGGALADGDLDSLIALFRDAGFEIDSPAQDGEQQPASQSDIIRWGREHAGSMASDRRPSTMIREAARRITIEEGGLVHEQAAQRRLKGDTSSFFARYPDAKRLA